MPSFLIIGCGSIGKRHCQNLLSLGQVVYIYDKEAEREQELVDKYKVKVYDFKSHHIPIDCFVVATPPNYHIPFAFEALEHNSHIFIEKPLSHNLERVDELLAKAESQKRLIQVGYQFRFHPGLRLAKKLIKEGKLGEIRSIRANFGSYLPNWHPEEDYRQSYFCYKAQGGGIILDSSHEIDYVRWLANSEVKELGCSAKKVSDLEIETEDTANIWLIFENGVTANIHLDAVHKKYTRWCEVIGSQGDLLWDYHSHRLMMSTSFIPYSEKDMYLEEMRYWISCIETGKQPEVNAKVGKKVLELALMARKSAGVE